MKILLALRDWKCGTIAIATGALVWAIFATVMRRDLRRLRIALRKWSENFCGLILCCSTRRARRQYLVAANRDFRLAIEWQACLRGPVGHGDLVIWRCSVSGKINRIDRGWWGGASGIFDSGERQDQREGRNENGTQDSGNSTLRQARNDQGTIEVVQQMEQREVGRWTRIV
jgi:hypothetical protein